MFMNLFRNYMIFIGIFGQLMFFAQAYKIYKTKSVIDVSLLGFSVGLLSVTSWMVYGILIHDTPLIVGNAVATVGALSVVIGILIYKK
jgi:MtN3 and saliva related transmembrane protein